MSALEPPNLVLLGPPGAGKGTPAALEQDELALRYLSSGDLLRRHRSESTALGRMAAKYIDDGQLVPDELVIEMLMEALEGSPRGSCSTASRERSPRRTRSMRDLRKPVLEPVTRGPSAEALTAGPARAREPCPAVHGPATGPRGDSSV